MLTSIWTKIKSAASSVGLILAGVFALLFFLEKKRADGAEEQALNASTKAKDDALKAQGDALAADSTKVEADAAKEKAQPQTEQDLVNFLNKNDV